MARYAVRVVALSASLVGLALVPVAAARAETATFSFTGAEQTYTVPAGVSTLRIVAIGGAGGAPSQFGGAGGKAGAVGADLAVTPGENLLVVVGGNGGNGVDGLGDGGFNGGATGGKSTAAAGGGGGASDVRLLPLVDPGSPATRLVVAGGGGGAGTVVTSTETAVGGDAGMDGSNSIFASYGGRAGTASLEHRAHEGDRDVGGGIRHHA